MTANPSTLKDFLEEYGAINQESDLKKFIEKLEPFGKRVGVLAGIAAISIFEHKHRYAPEEVRQAYAAVKAWAENPSEVNAQACQEAIFTPKGLWTNCNDIMHVTKIAVANLVCAASPDGNFEHIKHSILVMAHPLVSTPQEVWSAIIEKLRSEV